jgi:two-component system, OmpR family, sensor kinase
MALSLRTKLTLKFSLVLATLLGLAAVVLITTLQGIAERKLDATLWMLGATEAEGVVANMRGRGLSDPDEQTIHDVDYRQLPGYENFRVQKYVTVVNDKHQVADFSINLPRPLPVDDSLVVRALTGDITYQTTDVDGVGRLRMIYIPVIGQQTKPFVLIVGVPTSFVGVELSSVLRRTSAVIAIVLGLAALSGLALARRALRPISETADAVKRISDRNLNEKLPEPGTNDEIDRLIKVFNELLGRLDLAFEMQRRFTSDASHEIGTPLTVLRGNTEVALLERHKPEEYESILRSNLEEIERLTQLTSNLLLLARSDSGEPQITKDVLSLNEQVPHIISRLLPLAQDRGITLVVNTGPPVFVEGDRPSLLQIIFNLVSNALRYTPAGGRVEVKIFMDGDHTAKLEVIDTGVGISPQDLPRIFDRFYRTKSARGCEPAGSGLGLAICRTLAEAHGGRIYAQSCPGTGSCFTLMLPAIEFASESKAS